MATIINPKTKQSLKDAIIELYLNIKIRSSEEIAEFTEEKYEKERETLEGVDLFLVLEYIRSTVEILMNMKAEEEEHANKESKSYRSEESMPEPPKEYEQMVQKLEEEVRNHIRVEQQLKVHIEATQFKMDDLEKAKEQSAKQIQLLNNKVKTLQERSRRDELELERLKKELLKKGERCQVLEEKCTALRQQQSKMEGDFEKDKLCRASANTSPQGMSVQEEKIPLFHSSAKRRKNTSYLEGREGFASDKSPNVALGSIIKSIHAPKGVGIKEQNIYQIICKSPDPTKDRNPYVMEIVSQNIEGKNKEIQKLKQKLSKLQTEIKVKRTASRESSTKAKKGATSPSSLIPDSSHTRSKSQKSTMHIPREEIEVSQNRSQHVYSEKPMPKRYIKGMHCKGTSSSASTSMNVGDYSQILGAHQYGTAEGEKRKQTQSRRAVTAASGGNKRIHGKEEIRSSNQQAKFIEAKLDSILVKYPKK